MEEYNLVFPAYQFKRWRAEGHENSKPRKPISRIYLRFLSMTNEFFDTFKSSGGVGDKNIHHEIVFSSFLADFVDLSKEIIIRPGLIFF